MQLVVIEMVDNGAAPVAMFGAVLLINLRMVAYATALSPQWRSAPVWWKAL